MNGDSKARQQSESAGIGSLLEESETKELVYEVRVDAAMRKGACTVSPDDSMAELRKILRARRISGAPVVEGGKVIGIVSVEDVIRCVLEGKFSEKVRAVMSTPVTSLFADEHLVAAIARFEKTGFRRFPVLDRKSGALVGIITKGDIIRYLLRRLEAEHHAEEMLHVRVGHLFEDIISDKSVLVMRYKVEGGDFEKAGEKSSKLKNNLLRLGSQHAHARRITIASYEAEMNMVIFTPGGELIVSVETEKVTVNAVDKGPGIPDIDRAMQPGYSTAPDWVRELGFGAGMGLPNIKNCSDEMHIESRVGEGTTVQFTVVTGPWI